MSDACSSAGNWLFRGRKWIDPADPDGRTMLQIHHHNLSILFPAATAACSLGRFIDAVAAVAGAWSGQSEAALPSLVHVPPPSPTATGSDAASPPSEARAAARWAGLDSGGDDDDPLLRPPALAPCP